MKRRYIYWGVSLLIGFLILNKTFSKLKPVPKVSFSSRKLDYNKKEPGSFKIDKAAKWIGKDKALITIDVDSHLGEVEPYKDILFVLDVSASMEGARLDRVKRDVKEMTNSFLTNNRNRAALISFSSNFNKLSDFTTNKDIFNSKVDRLRPLSSTNYKIGLEAAREMLKGYQKEEDKDLFLLFLTDGDPNEGTPNERAIYSALKKEYPYMHINAIQYAMGEDIKSDIKAISDKQFPADIDNLHNALFKAGSNPVIYDNFIITDFLSKHFKGDIKKIKASQGKAHIDGDKITWDLGKYASGSKAKLEIEVERVGEVKDFYETNSKLDFNTSYLGKEDNQSSDKTPILKGTYKVIYEANAPSDCTVTNLAKVEDHSPYDTVYVNQDEAFCNGYLFKGYKLVSKLDKAWEDYFVMPEGDVVLKAIWTKLKVNKSMDGTVKQLEKLTDAIKKQSLGNAKDLGIDFKEDASDTNGEGVYLFDESKNDKHPVYFYRGSDRLNNNLIYANFCWKIVRTTQTGGVRILYNGVPREGKCYYASGSNAEIGESPFNKPADHKKYTGYMYGDDENPYQNINDSEVKKYIDNWYKLNIKDKGFEGALDKDAIYCGNRMETPDGLDIKYSKEAKEGLLSMACPLNDSYGVTSGNKKLKYPVALLSLDEAMMAGAGWMNGMNMDYYIYNGNMFWLLSPSLGSEYNDYYITSVEYRGDLNHNRAYLDEGVRPVVTLSGYSFLTDGNGSAEKPYLIQ